MGFWLLDISTQAPQQGSVRDLRGVVSPMAAKGPRLTFMSLNGPFSMQPPPCPAGLRPLELCVVLMPCPLMLVSLPSKMGDVSGLVAHLPQSQYCSESSVFRI